MVYKEQWNIFPCKYRHDKMVDTSGDNNTEILDQMFTKETGTW